MSCQDTRHPSTPLKHTHLDLSTQPSFCPCCTQKKSHAPLDRTPIRNMAVVCRPSVKRGVTVTRVTSGSATAGLSALHSPPYKMHTFLLLSVYHIKTLQVTGSNSLCRFPQKQQITTNHLLSLSSSSAKPPSASQRCEHHSPASTSTTTRSQQLLLHMGKAARWQPVRLLVVSTG